MYKLKSIFLNQLEFLDFQEALLLCQYIINHYDNFVNYFEYYDQQSDEKQLEMENFLLSPSLSSRIESITQQDQKFDYNYPIRSKNIIWDNNSMKLYKEIFELIAKHIVNLDFDSVIEFYQWSILGINVQHLKMNNEMRLNGEDIKDFIPNLTVEDAISFFTPYFDQEFLLASMGITDQKNKYNNNEKSKKREKISEQEKLIKNIKKRNSLINENYLIILLEFIPRMSDNLALNFNILIEDLSEVFHGGIFHTFSKDPSKIQTGLLKIKEKTSESFLIELAQFINQEFSDDIINDFQLLRQNIINHWPTIRNEFLQESNEKINLKGFFQNISDGINNKLVKKLITTIQDWDQRTEDAAIESFKRTSDFLISLFHSVIMNETLDLKKNFHQYVQSLPVLIKEKLARSLVKADKKTSEKFFTSNIITSIHELIQDNQTNMESEISFGTYNSFQDWLYSLKAEQLYTWGQWLIDTEGAAILCSLWTGELSKVNNIDHCFDISVINTLDKISQNENEPSYNSRPYATREIDHYILNEKEGEQQTQQSIRIHQFYEYLIQKFINEGLLSSFDQVENFYKRLMKGFHFKYHEVYLKHLGTDLTEIFHAMTLNQEIVKKFFIQHFDRSAMYQRILLEEPSLKSISNQELYKSYPRVNLSFMKNKKSA